VGTRSPSSWKGRSTQEGTGEKGTSHPKGEDSTIQRGKGGIDGEIAEAKGV